MVKMSTIALNNTLMRRMKIDPGFWSRSRALVPASIISHMINCDLCKLFPLFNFTYTFYQVCKRNNAFKSKKMLYFWINGLETTEKECLTQQQNVFVSVFSISFSLAAYLVFNSANPLRVRFRSYTNYRHSCVAVLFIPLRSIVLWS